MSEPEATADPVRNPDACAKCYHDEDVHGHCFDVNENAWLCDGDIDCYCDGYADPNANRQPRTPPAGDTR